MGSNADNSPAWYRGATGLHHPDADHVSTFGRALLAIVLVELLLGGNGYLTEIAGVRLRVWLFMASMAWVAVRLLSPGTRPLPLAVWGLLLMFVVVTGTGTAIGLVSGNSIEVMAGELKPLIYFPLILYYALAIRTADDIDFVLRLIVVCAVIQAVAYLAVLICVHSGLVPYPVVYNFLKDSDEFIFRAADKFPTEEYFNGFFYKGAIHLCVAAVVLLIDPVRRNVWLALMLFAAIVLTFTRGPMLSLAMTFVYGALFLPLRYRLPTFLALTVVLVAALVSQDFVALVQRPESDEVRLSDLRTIWSELDARMTLIGMGLGAPIGERDRIEMTYLEVFYKQGAIGLSLWIALFAVNLAALKRVHGARWNRALSLHLTAVFVYLQTATNTFLTGSIGMSIVLISTVSLLAMRADGNQVRVFAGARPSSR